MKKNKNHLRFTIYDLRFFGFTLIELLVVIALLGVIGAIIGGILSQVFQGSNKVKIGNSVSQNENYASSVITDVITSSTGVINGTGLAVCAPQASAVSQPGVQLQRIDGGVTTLNCTGTNIASNSANLLDSNTVQATGCSFTCIQSSPYVAPLIQFQFTVSGLSPTSSLKESQSSQTYTNSVGLQDFQQL